MRRLLPLLASLALLAACSGSAATPTAAPTAAPAVTATPAPPTPIATSAPAASASPAAVSGLVTYDGKTCTYTGPTVLPEGATLQIQFAPSVETHAVNWVPALRGTTLAQVKKDDGGAIGPDYSTEFPAWAWGTAGGSFMGSGTIPLDLAIYKVGSPAAVYDNLVIACARTAPSTSDPTAVNLLDLATATLISIMPE